MNNSHIDDLKFYENRIEEFDKLIAEAKSQTLFDLLIQAKIKSANAVKMLIQIQEATTIYLKAYELKNDEDLKKIKNQIELQSVELKKLTDAQFDSRLKKSFLQIHELSADMIINSLHKKEELRRLTFKVFTSCAKEFKDVLLEKIFNPNNSKFHYETIIDILNYIIGKFVPLFDEAKAIAEFSPIKRRKDYANHGDKLLIYLEQYIDVLEKWTILGNTYIKLTKS